MYSRALLSSWYSLNTQAWRCDTHNYGVLFPPIRAASYRYILEFGRSHWYQSESFTCVDTEFPWCMPYCGQEFSTGPYPLSFFGMQMQQFRSHILDKCGTPPVLSRYVRRRGPEISYIHHALNMFCWWLMADKGVAQTNQSFAPSSFIIPLENSHLAARYLRSIVCFVGIQSQQVLFPYRRHCGRYSYCYHSIWSAYRSEWKMHIKSFESQSTAHLPRHRWQPPLGVFAQFLAATAMPSAADDIELEACPHTNESYSLSSGMGRT